MKKEKWSSKWNLQGSQFMDRIGRTEVRQAGQTKHLKDRRQRLLCLLLVFLLLAGLKPVQEIQGKVSGDSVLTETTKAGAEISSEDLEACVDSFFEKQSKKYQIPGMTVVVVKNGETLLKKAYGVKDAGSGAEFDADNTTFRIASITKVFTAAALMQLVQEGKVDLKADIQTYLPDLELKNPYNKPVTVEQLLTHTSGIDSSCIGDLSKEKISMPCGYLLSEMNQKNLTVAREPGKYIEYSSYGVVLEGCIIEAVTKESCRDYISGHILEPLHMDHTVMEMEDEALSSGYNVINGKLVKKEFLGCFKLYPEGGLISSAGDMERFMKYCLSDADMKEMLVGRVTFDAALPGMGYGFSEYEEAGIRLMGHGGYAPDGFLSQIDLYPENTENTQNGLSGIGTFVVVNQGSNNNVTDDFRKAFLQYMEKNGIIIKEDDSQEEKAEVITAETALPDALVPGTYRFRDYSKTTICKGDAFGGVKEITVKKERDEKEGKDGIRVSGMDDFSGEPYSFWAKKEGEGRYRCLESGYSIIFRAEERTGVSMAMTDTSWHGYYEKLSWYETGKIQMPVFIGGILLFFGCILAGLVFGIRRLVRIIWKKEKAGSRFVRIKWTLITLVSIFFDGFFAYSMFYWGDRLRYGISLAVKINLMMPVAGSLCLALLIIWLVYGVTVGRNAVKALEGRKKPGIWAAGVFDVIFCLMGVLFIGLFCYWNMFGFHY